MICVKLLKPVSYREKFTKFFVKDIYRFRLINDFF